MKMLTEFNYIGKNFDDIITDKKLSRKQLSYELDIPYSSLLDFLNDRSGRKYIDILEKLSSKFNVREIDIILGEYTYELIKENTSEYNTNLIDLNDLEPEYRKQVEKIIKLNDEHQRKISIIKNKYNNQ